MVCEYRIPIIVNALLISTFSQNFEANETDRARFVRVYVGGRPSTESGYDPFPTVSKW